MKKFKELKISTTDVRTMSAIQVEYLVKELKWWLNLAKLEHQYRNY